LQRGGKFPKLRAGDAWKGGKISFGIITVFDPSGGLTNLQRKKTIQGREKVGGKTYKSREEGTTVKILSVERGVLGQNWARERLG